MRFLHRFELAAYVVLRLAAGLMFLVHGLPKLFGVLGGTAQAFGTQLWWGGLIEVVGGACIALGFFTRAAAFLCSGTMAVAYLQFHWKLDLADLRWLPSVNKGELALVYAFLFLFIATRGPGGAALDARFGRS